MRFKGERSAPLMFFRVNSRGTNGGSRVGGGQGGSGGGRRPGGGGFHGVGSRG